MRGGGELRFVAIAAIALGACVATEPAVPARGVVVSGPPPAPIAEGQTASPAPSPRAVWVAGYWHWNGMQYAWIPGHWDENAPPGAAWSAPRVVTANGAYFYEAGTWQPAHGTGARHPSANALR